MTNISVSGFLRGTVPTSYEITPNRTVDVGSNSFFSNLTRLLESTPRETVYDFFQWYVIRKTAGALHRSYTAPLLRFENTYNDTNKERWKTCVVEMKTQITSLLGAIFSQRVIPPGNVQLTEHMASDIKAAFKERLIKADWMSPTTKISALKKRKCSFVLFLSSSLLCSVMKTTLLSIIILMCITDLWAASLSCCISLSLFSLVVSCTALTMSIPVLTYES